VATGRVATVEDLGLELAGVEHAAGQGVLVDALLATSNSSVFAVGDCAAGVPRLTHLAGEMAKVAVQNALFGDSWSLDYAQVRS